MPVGQPRVYHRTAFVREALGRPWQRVSGDAPLVDLTGHDERPLVSIITTTFNAAHTLRACIDSVQAQDYPNLEHIIVDGASTDGSIALLSSYTATNIHWRSEPDAGIFDAWNKGLARARGEWIAFVGADDVLLPAAVSAYMQLAAANPEALYLSSQVQWVGPRGATRIIGRSWSWPRFQRYMCTAHVGSMHHRQLFAQYGQYDSSLIIVADYELLLRPGKHLRAAFLPQVTVRMQGGGNSDRLDALDEAVQVKVATGKRQPLLAAVERILARQAYRLRKVLPFWR